MLIPKVLGSEEPSFHELACISEEHIEDVDIELLAVEGAR
jgi:hypothetical protein